MGYAQDTLAALSRQPMVYSKGCWAGAAVARFQKIGDLPRLRMTDSTTPPPRKPAIFFNERNMAARHEGGCGEKYT